jgi:hypothetical protein
MAEQQQDEAPRGFFQHTGHVKLGWLYLHKYPIDEALTRISESLQMFATENGAPEMYNQTLTSAYMFLIYERMTLMDDAHAWQEFADANADLLNWEDSIVRKYYSEQRLNSELAKKTFLLPDRTPA